MTSIFIFSWNTQSVKYNETNTDFINALLNEKINHDILVFCFQEFDSRHCTLDNIITEYLSAEYKLIENVDLIGWGITTYKSLSHGEYRPRGLKTLVYSKLENIRVTSKSYKCLSPSIIDKITYGKGCIITNIFVFDKNISILNVHLPFSSVSLLNGSRHESVEWQFYVLQYFYNNGLEYDPDFLFIVGDLNFRTTKNILDPCFFTNYNDFYKKYDELYLYSKYVIPFKINEGIENSGIDFAPTCKMNKDREPMSINYKLGKWGQRFPSWCDRILYTDFVDFKTKCVMYERWEHSHMILSDHCAVLGTFIV